SSPAGCAWGRMYIIAGSGRATADAAVEWPSSESDRGHDDERNLLLSRFASFRGAAKNARAGTHGETRKRTYAQSLVRRVIKRTRALYRGDAVARAFSFVNKLDCAFSGDGSIDGNDRACAHRSLQPVGSQPWRSRAAPRQVFPATRRRMASER